MFLYDFKQNLTFPLPNFIEICSVRAALIHAKRQRDMVIPFH